MSDLLPDGTTVKFRNTASPLDGTEGIIRGVAMQNVWGIGQIYIVELTTVLPDYPYTCVAMTQSCLLVPVNVKRGCGSMPCGCMGTCMEMVPQEESVLRKESQRKFGA